MMTIDKLKQDVYTSLQMKGFNICILIVLSKCTMCSHYVKMYKDDSIIAIYQTYFNMISYEQMKMKI